MYWGKKKERKYVKNTKFEGCLILIFFYLLLALNEAKGLGEVPLVPPQPAELGINGSVLQTGRGPTQ